MLYIDTFTCPHITRITIGMNVSLDTGNINEINMYTLTSEHANILAESGPHPTCRNWQYPLSASHTALQRYDQQKWTYSLICHQGWWRPISHMDNLKHPVTYIGTTSFIFVLCIDVYCFKFWIRPASPRCHHYSPASLWYAIVDDNVEVAPFYQCRARLKSP